MSESPEIEPEDTTVESSGPRPIKERTKSTGGAIVGAAMLGIGQVYEPQNTDVNIEVEADADRDELDLDFGDLPELN